MKSTGIPGDGTAGPPPSLLEFLLGGGGNDRPSTYLYTSGTLKIKHNPQNEDSVACIGRESIAKATETRGRRDPPLARAHGGKWGKRQTFKTAFATLKLNEKATERRQRQLVSMYIECLAFGEYLLL